MPMPDAATAKPATYQPGCPERLALLDAAIDKLPMVDYMAVKAHLLGGLTCYVDDATFEGVLAAALASVGRHG